MKMSRTEAELHKDFLASKLPRVGSYQVHSFPFAMTFPAENTRGGLPGNSCRIPFSKTNICVGLLSGVVAAAFSCMTTTVSKLANELICASYCGLLYG